jgi:hypothetical protein
MGRTYPKIERFFIYNSIVILLLTVTLQCFYWLANSFANAYAGVFAMFATFALESQSLAAYSSSLEKNLEDIMGIKHDVKNYWEFRCAKRQR